VFLRNGPQNENPKLSRSFSGFFIISFSVFFYGIERIILKTPGPLILNKDNFYFEKMMQLNQAKMPAILRGPAGICLQNPLRRQRRYLF
jgi:hypothetical protein